MTVSIVEDQRPARESLRQLINATPDLTCLAAYPNAERALENIPLEPPDLVLMDLELPGTSGADCIRALKEKLPGLTIIVVTQHDDGDHLFEALRAGADGYLLKGRLLSELPRAITEARQGKTPLSPEMATLMVRHFQTAAKRNPELEQLTDRQLEVLKLIARGLLYKEVAAALGISLETVNDHIKNIYKKLHVRNRTEAAEKLRGGF